MTPEDSSPDQSLDDVLEEWGAESVAAALAESDSAAPPPALRDAVLARAAERPRGVVAATSPVEVFGARVEALRALLDDLADDEWQLVAAPYEWTVHGLVAHLLVIERYTAHTFGIEPLTAPDLADEHDHLGMGATVIAAEQSRPPIDTANDWHTAALGNAHHTIGSPLEAEHPAGLHGWPFSQTSALIARAFEIWTHSDDIRRATGRPLDPPTAGELRTMSSFSVGSLPFLLPLGESRTAMPPVRVVLTGAGGATFDIGGPGERAAMFSADIVDYCRVVARRIAPSDLRGERQGDLDLIDDLLAASSAFAV